MNMTNQRYEELRASIKDERYAHRGWLIINGNLMTDLTVDAHVFVSGNVYAPLRATGKIVCDGEVNERGLISDYISPAEVSVTQKYLEKFDILVTGGRLEFSDSITADERTGKLFTQGVVCQCGPEIGVVVLNKDLTIVTDNYSALIVENSNIFEVNENIKLTAISLHEEGAVIIANGIFMIYPGAVIEVNGKDRGFVNDSNAMFISKGDLITYGKIGIYNRGIMLNYNSIRSIGTESGIMIIDGAKFTVGCRGVVNTFGCNCGFVNATRGYSKEYTNSEGKVVKDWCRGGVLIVEEGGVINCVGAFDNRPKKFFDGRTNVNGVISISGIGIDKKYMFRETEVHGKGKVYINGVTVYDSKRPVEDMDKWIN